MRTIIAGGRTFSDWDLLTRELDQHLDVITEVVSGCAKGADHLGELWALKNNIPIHRFPAYWQGQGKAAGPIRNTKMAEYADALIAFWNGKSSGTTDMIAKAKKRGLTVTIIGIP